MAPWSARWSTSFLSAHTVFSRLTTRYRLLGTSFRLTGMGAARGRRRAPISSAPRREAQSKVLLRICSSSPTGGTTTGRSRPVSYQHFLDGYAKLRRDRNLSYGRPFRPLLVGIVWPSTDLVLPWESGPVIAAPSPDHASRDDAAVAQERREIQDLATGLDGKDVDRFYDLTQRAAGLDPAEELEMARLLAPLYAAEDEVPEPDRAPNPEGIVEIGARRPLAVPLQRRPAMANWT